MNNLIIAFLCFRISKCACHPKDNLLSNLPDTYRCIVAMATGYDKLDEVQFNVTTWNFRWIPALFPRVTEMHNKKGERVDYATPVLATSYSIGPLR